MYNSSFRYEENDTLIHSIDPRVKIIIIGGLSSILIYDSYWINIVLGVLILLSGWIGKTKLLSCFSEIKPILVLFILIIVTHTVFTSNGPFLEIIGLNWSIKGLISGIEVVSRLFLIVSMGFIYSNTTKPVETRLAVEWFLQPLPLNENILGTTASLGIRFFPLMSEEARRTREAEKVRCSNITKNPVRRLRNAVIPFLVRGIRRADRLSDSLKTRCYSLDRTSMVKLKINKLSYSVLIIVGLLVFFLHLYCIS